MSSIRLLISAHDPGAANAIIPVILKAETDPRFDLFIVAHGPAIDIFKSAGINARNIEVPRITKADDPDYKILFNTANILLDEVCPDAVLNGLSGTDAGLDEALINSVSDSTLTFSLQDFWGDVNPILPLHAKIFLVPDSYAEKITKSRIKAEVIPVGMPAYTGLQLTHSRNEARKELGLKEDMIGLFWFGQPLWSVKGYPDSLMSFSKSVSMLDLPSKLFYKPHPRESKDDIKKSTDCFYANNNEVTVVNAVDNKILLAACDVAISAYSLIGLDLLQMQRVSTHSFGIPVYYLVNSDLYENYKKYTGLNTMPLVDMGLALACFKEEELGKIIQEALLMQKEDKISKLTKKIIPDSKTAPSRILDIIYKKVSEYVKDVK